MHDENIQDSIRRRYKYRELKKHKGVSLADAEAVFYDDAALTLRSEERRVGKEC